MKATQGHRAAALSKPSPIGLAILASAGAASEQLTPEARQHIHSFLQSQRHSTGGFVGRCTQGKPDLYYTFFGMAGMLLTGETKSLRPTQQWLETFALDSPELDFIHLICLARARVMARWMWVFNLPGSRNLPALLNKESGVALAKKFQQVRKPFGKEESATLKAAIEALQGDEAARRLPELYITFLLYQLYEETQVNTFSPAQITEELDRCLCPDGGYGSSAGMKEGVTSATAAGLVLAKRVGETPAPDAFAWLRQQASETGGFLAAPGAPIADLLGTAVALFAFDYCGERLEDTWLETTEEFVSAHWNEDGGFCGTVLDPDSDAEYTFYGLLALGCLHRLKTRNKPS